MCNGYRWCRAAVLFIILTTILLGDERPSDMDTRIWSKTYWFQKARQLNFQAAVPDAAIFRTVYTGSRIASRRVQMEDSPDVIIPPSFSTISQSENSVFVDPNDPTRVLNSNNSSDWPVNQIFGASGYFSTDGGQTWDGSEQGTGGTNGGDPAVAIGLNGRFFNGYIAADGGQGVAYSDDGGATWTHVQVAPIPGVGGLADKNHLWIDNSPTSPFEGNLYAVWTDFGGPNDTEIVVSRSTNNGASWSTRVPISTAVNAGSHNQGVNVQTGPNGEVYAVWIIYDAWPATENAIGFSKSTDGGVTWSPAVRIHNNIKGIRNGTVDGGLGGGKTMRCASFPSMTVDPDGNIYVVWTNQGVPGVNNGDPDIYVMKSTDGGSTWQTPVRVNQDTPGNGKDQWFPWVAADPASGALVCVFYDSRNFPGNDMAETFVATSSDGGATWEDFKVSDIAWSGDGIAGFSADYAGDYIGIDIQDGRVYPVWTDFRSGVPTAVTSPFTLADPGDPNPPTDVTAFSDFTTPNSIALSWTDPVTLVDGTPLNAGDFTIEIERDGAFIASVTGGTESYVDAGTLLRSRAANGTLIDGQLYTYTLRTKLVSNDSLSIPATASAYAGGAPTPAAPTNLACSNTETTAILSWDDPTTQVDGTALDDLDSLRIYRDGALVGRALPGAETFVDAPPPGSIYTYTVTAVDNETPRNESASSNAAMCFVGSVPDYLVWVGPTAAGTSAQSGDSLFQSLSDIGASVMLTNDLFEFGTDLSVYKAVFVVLGVYSNNHILGATDLEAAALDTYLQNGGCIYLEGGDCFNYDPDAAGVNGYNIRPWFGLLDGPDGSADVSGIAGAGPLAEFNFAYGGPNNWMDELQPNGSTVIWENSTNTDISGVFYDGYGTGRAIGVVPTFGGLTDAGSTAPHRKQGPALAAGHAGKTHPIRSRNDAWFVKKAAHYPERAANRKPLSRLIRREEDGGVKILANTKDDLMTAYLGLFDHAVETSFAASYLAGWNMVGLPLSVADSAYQTLYPDAVTNGLFSYNGIYESQTHLTRGTGYWLNFSRASSVNITGEPINQVTLTLQPGWNMIAPPSCSLPVESISDPDNVIIPGTIFGFNGGYFAATTLQQGFAYWVNASDAGAITITCNVTALPKTAPAKPHQIAGIDLADAPRLEFRDATGGVQTLYYNIALGKDIDRRVFRLPPVPPFGFDVRFAGDMRVSEEPEALILLQSGGYPLRITAHHLPAENGASRVLEALADGEVLATHALREGQPVEISDARVTALRLGRQQAGVPAAFAVAQNYPNPFNPATEIRYALPEPAKVKLIIYNALGQKVRTLIAATRPAGWHTATWDGTNDAGQPVSSGIYLYRLSTPAHSAVQKMILLR